MTPFATQAPTPADVRATASVCRDVLERFADADWDGPAGELEWSCRTNLAHVLAALLYYAINLATRSTEPRFSGQSRPIAPDRGAPRRIGWEGRGPSPRCARHLRPALAGPTTGARLTRLGSQLSGATRCSCTRTTSPMGSKPPSNPRYSLAWSPGHREAETLGGAVVGERPLGVWRSATARAELGAPPVTPC